MRNLMMALALGALLAAGAAAAAPGAITVSGNRFLKDGVPWVAEGVTLIGLVAPTKQLRPAYARARERFGPGMLGDVHDYGADLIRYQVSQAGLDPQSPIHDPNYRAEVLGAVALARAEGFNVIVSMQWQGPAGHADQEGMPSDVTRRAWGEIIGAIGQDRGILLELFNEPALKEPSPENWAVWQTGMQSLIDLVRAAGAQNVVLADGLRSGHYLGGSPPLDDPAGALGFAVHPFLTAINKHRGQWNDNFGVFARTHPVMATAFNARSNNGYCRETFPQEVDKLLTYLGERGIGLVIWAFDLPGVMRAGKLSDYENFSCEPGGGSGAGLAVHEYFMAN